MSSQATSPKPDVRFASTGSSFYPTLVAVTCVVLVVSNIAATKGIEFGSGSFEIGPVQVWPLIVDGGLFLFPLAYIIGDVISEVYGFKAARRAIFTAFALMILTAVTFWVVQQAPAASWYEGQQAFEAVVAPVAIIVVASLSAYVVGNLTNAFVVVRLKKRMAERGLISRLIASSVAGQSLDTVVFCVIAASAIGITTWGQLVNYIVIGIVGKVLIEIAIMPLTVAVIAWFKRAEPTY